MSNSIDLILNEIKNALGYVTDDQLATAIGITKANLSQWRRRNSMDVNKVATALPAVSANYLLRGEGPVLGKSAIDTVSTAQDVVRYYPNIPATAGDIENMPEPSYEDQQPTLYVIPGLGGCDAMPATGNSMYPTITAGDMVVHKVWQDGSYIRNGEIYVILTNDGQRMIKRLTYVSTDEDGDKHYICRSDNPDQDKYAPFEVLGSSIRQLSIVKAILSRIE